MPTYQYRCRDCGTDLEAQQAFTDDPLTECPACGGSLRKVFSAVGISFKGSGFYKNDSRGKTSSTTPSSDESGSSRGEKSETSTSSDSSSTSTTSTTSTTSSESSSSSSSPSSGSTTTSAPAASPATKSA